MCCFRCVVDLKLCIYILAAINSAAQLYAFSPFGNETPDQFRTMNKFKLLICQT